MSEAPPARSWFRVGVADVLFVVLVLGMMRTSRTGMLDDPGLGWHIRNIDAMLEQGGWLTHDPFTLNRGDQRWFANQWLGDVLLWLANRWAGLNGIAVVVTLVLAGTIRLLYGMLIRDGVPWPAAFCWAVLAALGTSSGWVARPNIFTILFTLVTARTCDLLHRGEPCRPWLLVPLFTIWANMHGGFIAGFIVLVASIGIELAMGVLADSTEDRQSARGRAILLLMVTASSAAATLINPYGIELYSWIFQLLGDSYFMTLHDEWLSPNFRDAGAFRYELLILLLPVIVAYSEKKPSLLLLCLSVIWLHFALGGRRYVTLFVVVVTPLLARHSIEIAWLKERAKRWLSDDMKMLLSNRPVRPAFFWSLVLAIGLLFWARESDPYAGHNLKHTPTPALDRILANYDGQVIFHAYGWGGYLTWHGWDKQPRLLNWIDDRNEVQGKAHIQEHRAIVGGADLDWRGKLDAAKVEVIVLPPNQPLVRHLRQDPGWRQTYADPYAVIFERVAEP